MRPNTMNRFGAVLDDFGLDTMLEKLMEDFIRPISRGKSFIFLLGCSEENKEELIEKITWISFDFLL